MSYTRKTWETGEVIDEAALNNIEAGIEANSDALDAPENIIFPTGRALLSNAGYHNSIFRGKNLGKFTSTMSDEIKARSYNGLCIGDTFTYDGRVHTIAHFEPLIGCGDSISLGGHIAVVSDGGWSSIWNETNDTSTGYVGSKIREYIKSSGGPQEQIIADFGESHVLAYRAIYPTTYSNGAATGWAWADARTELPNETTVYGHQVWAKNGHEDGIDKFQFAIFRLMPQFASQRATWWLRSVRSASAPCCVGNAGRANGNQASYSIGVRPFSLIG